ncbi:hypothetical protein H4Q26_010890 [Puccinia striiformis f. sp. tritici PST-130]|nr:hypothetical protein H4Q26_010890 [Puccinia striiformis f. sp. tritici PST-130]
MIRRSINNGPVNQARPVDLDPIPEIDHPIERDLARPADLDHSSKIDHPTDRMFLSDFLNHRKLI